MKTITTLISILFSVNIAIYSQVDSIYKAVDPINLSGPRVGVTFLNAEQVNSNTTLFKLKKQLYYSIWVAV